jgi:hypothetical protein
MVYISPDKREEVQVLIRGFVLAQMRRQQRIHAGLPVDEMAPEVDAAPSKPRFTVIEGGKARTFLEPTQTLLADGNNPQSLLRMDARDIPYYKMPIAATLNAGDGATLTLGGVPQPTGREVMDEPRLQLAAYLLGQVVAANSRRKATAEMPFAVNARSVRQAARVGEAAERFPSHEYPGMTKQRAVMGEVLDYVDYISRRRAAMMGEHRMTAKTVWRDFDDILRVTREEGVTAYDLYQAALARKAEPEAPYATPQWMKPDYDEHRDHRRPVPKAEGGFWNRVRGWWDSRSEDGFDWAARA